MHCSPEVTQSSGLARVLSCWGKAGPLRPLCPFHKSLALYWAQLQPSWAPTNPFLPLLTADGCSHLQVGSLGGTHANPLLQIPSHRTPSNNPKCPVVPARGLFLLDLPGLLSLESFS